MINLLPFVIGTLLVPSQSADIELRLVFDQQQVALGDVISCEVQIWNLRGPDKELPQPCQLGNMYFMVECGDKTYRPDIGGAFIIPEYKVVKAREYLSAPAIVKLFNKELLDESQEGTTKLSVKAALQLYGSTWIKSKPTDLYIVDRVSRNDALIRRLYPTLDELNAAMDRDDFYHTLDAVSVYEIVMQDQLSRTVLDRLHMEIKPGTLLYHQVAIARVIDDFIRLRTLTEESLEKELLKVLATCTPTERRWLQFELIDAFSIHGRPDLGKRISEMNLEERLKEFAF